ncbi:hypothetical protein [Limisphaera ngatamarikiensis]|nr:hypothetical protein [Limisphaera ngatamarikiensis]
MTMKPGHLWTVSIISILVTSVCEGMEANRPPRLVPTNNIEAARSKYPLSDVHRLAPNTLEFEEWALSFMLAKANEVREKWKLGIPRPLTVHDVYFTPKATAFGIDGSIGTRDGCYSWSFSRHHFDLFTNRDPSGTMIKNRYGWQKSQARLRPKRPSPVRARNFMRWGLPKSSSTFASLRSSGGISSKITPNLGHRLRYCTGG